MTTKIANGLPSIRATAAELAAMPDGVNATELAKAKSISTHSAMQVLWKMSRVQGLLHVAERRGERMRYFASVADRDTYLRRPTPKFLAAPTNTPSNRRGQAIQIVPGSLPATVTIKAPKERPVVVPADVKITHCPAPEFMGPGARCQVSSNARVVGGFATLGVGKYL